MITKILLITFLPSVFMILGLIVSYLSFKAGRLLVNIGYCILFCYILLAFSIAGIASEIISK